MGGRCRSRSRISRSYSPRRISRSPPRRKRYDDPRDRRPRRGVGGGRGFGDRRSAPSGLLIRNISLDARPEDLRVPFERFGPVRDVYLPRNYHTREPRGFGFVKFRNAEDAADAKQEMNHQVICGREISIVFADENRKTPPEMRLTGQTSGRYGGGRRRSPRSPRRRYRSYSCSPSPRHNARELDRSTRRVITLDQTLSPHHLAGIGNTGQSSDPPAPRGEGEAHPGLDLAALVLDDGAVLGPYKLDTTM